MKIDPSDVFKPWFDAALPLFEGGRTLVRGPWGNSRFYGVIYPNSEQMAEGREVVNISVQIGEDGAKDDIMPTVAEAIAVIRATDARWLA